MYVFTTFFIESITILLIKPIFFFFFCDRYNATKCFLRMGLTDDECLNLMCLLDDEFHTNFIDMELNIFQAMGFYNIAVYINHQ